MSDEISRRLDEAVARHGRESASGVALSAIASSVIGKARRRRRVTGALTVAGAFVGLAMVGGGALAAVNSWEDRRASFDSALDAPTVAMSQAPSPTPDTSAMPSADPNPTRAMENYPPVAATRGSEFPKAYEMRDWVWDYVGEGWSLQSYSGNIDLGAVKPAGENSDTVPDAAVYLVDPEGAAFELVELDAEHSVGLRVVSWQEDQRTARIVWDGAGETVTGGGGDLNLDTGEVTPLVFSTPWGVSSTVEPVAVSAAGNELWRAWLGTHVRYYRYGPADGWTVASVNDLEGIGDRQANPRWDTARLVGETVVGTRPDSAAVVFELRPTGTSAPSHVAVYDVDAEAYVAADVTQDFDSRPDSDCHVVSWVGDATLSYDCGDDTVRVTVALDRGVGAGAGYGEVAYRSEDGRVSKTSVVGYRAATDVAFLVAPSLP